MKLLVLATATAALLSVGCQSGVTFDSNLNPENFTEQAKPASVDVFTKDSILEHRYHSLGMVAGLACQESEDDYIATEADARTDACVVSVTCYGEAFKVDDSFKQQSKQLYHRQSSNLKAAYSIS